MTEMLKLVGVGKAFTLHVQDGAHIPVFDNVDLAVSAGESVVLTGPSGAGKSTLLRLAYGNYKCLAGQVLVRHRDRFVDLAIAAPQQVIEVRRETLGYVSQFLRVVPRVPTLDIVTEPLREVGVDRAEAEARAIGLLRRLNIPEKLWQLSPLTFSGGEQQRVNIARGLIAAHPVLLLDEPTASLDAVNRQVIVELIQEARQRGCALLGIFHDAEVRQAVGTREFDVTAVRAAA